MKLFEKWPWDSLLLKSYIIAPVILSPLTIYQFYSNYHYSLLILATIPAGLFLYIHFLKINKMMDTLLQCKSAKNGEAVAARLMFNENQSPGIAILRNDVIILIPVKGRRRKLPLSGIKHIEQSTGLSKTVITLETENSSQYTLKINHSIARKWLKKLTNATGHII